MPTATVYCRRNTKFISNIGDKKTIHMAPVPTILFSSIVNGKEIQADIVDYTPNDTIRIRFSDGYSDEFIFAGEHGDDIIGKHFEKSSPYAAAIQQDMQVFTYPVQALSVWRMAHKELGNIWIVKHHWEDEMHYGIFYHGQFQTDLQRIHSFGHAMFITGNGSIAADEEILKLVKTFIEKNEEEASKRAHDAEMPLLKIV